MDASTPPLAPRLARRAQGFGIAVYLLAVPVVIAERWASSYHVVHGPVVRILLVLVALLWLGFIVTVVRAGRHLRTGGHGTSGAHWLAGAVIGLLSVLLPSVASASPVHTTPAPLSTPAVASAPLAHLAFLLAAKRRRSELTPTADENIDAEIGAIDAIDLAPLQALHHFFDGASAGVATVPDTFDTLPVVDDGDPVVVCRLGQSPGQTLLGYARRGAVLPIAHEWTVNQLRDELVGLPESPLVFADSEHQLLRALATRRDRSTVVFTGHPSEIDDELRALCVCVAAPSSLDAPAPEHPQVSVLRATPQVLGLVEPFAPAVRRRCVEMVTYLALHEDPVSADRMRSRVLAHADVDASKGTLANTATAVRRSLGHDERGARLHAVTSTGLYALHGVTSDLCRFHELVVRARRASGDEAASDARDALRLVQGEPFSSVTRGYEWFTLEGHLASLQRDGEWAALTVAGLASDRGDFELAFWAHRQGLLLDPGNDTLLDALYAVPRLRQF